LQEFHLRLDTISLASLREILNKVALSRSLALSLIGVDQPLIPVLDRGCSA
jgi:hypothetical protein